LARWAGGEISVGTSGGNSHTGAVCLEFRYAPPPLTANTLVIGVTQSGETADTLAALTMENSVGQINCPISHDYWALPIELTVLATLVNQIIDTHGIEIELLLPKLYRPVDGVLLSGFDLVIVGKPYPQLD